MDRSTVVWQMEIAMFNLPKYYRYLSIFPDVRCPWFQSFKFQGALIFSDHVGGGGAGADVFVYSSFYSEYSTW